MKLDPQAVQALTALPDDALWNTVRQIAASKGFRLTATTPPPEQMRAIREALTHADKIDMGTAISMLKTYREKK